jgi:hypothetical protein
MKKNILSIVFILLSFYGIAQKRTPFPFKGGKEHMANFFKDSLIVSHDIIQKKATGLVVFKFTSDQLGNISRLVVCYADDPILLPPVIEALKKSNHRWVIPNGEQFNDFIITFSYSFNTPAASSDEVQKAVYDYISNRRPIISENQSLLENGILLPTVVVNYDIPQ